MVAVVEGLIIFDVVAALVVAVEGLIV